MLSILVPVATTTAAAKICPANLTNAGIFFTSSIKHVIPSITAPIKKPISLIP